MTDYQALGGVTGALQKSADAVYVSFDKEEQESMRNLMLRMVSLSGGETAGKRVLKSELVFSNATATKRYEKVACRLLEERLIRSGQDLEGTDFYEPSHDVLVRTWKTMQEWIKTFTEDSILLHARLDNAVTEYQRNGKKSNYLWYNTPNR